MVANLNALDIHSNWNRPSLTKFEVVTAEVVKMECISYKIKLLSKRVLIITGYS